MKAISVGAKGSRFKSTRVSNHSYHVMFWSVVKRNVHQGRRLGLSWPQKKSGRVGYNVSHLQVHTSRSVLVRSVNDEEIELPFVEYTATENSAFWETRPVAVAKRLTEVGASLGTWFASGVILGEPSTERASRLRSILTSLGPAYIKIGQAVSSRFVNCGLVDNVAESVWLL